MEVWGALSLPPAAVALSFSIQLLWLSDITQYRVVVGICWGEGGEERQASWSYIKCQCYPRWIQYLPQTPSCGYVSTTESQTPALLLSIRWDRALTNLHFHICFFAKPRWGKRPANKCWSLLAFFLTRLLAKWTAVNYPQAAGKIPHGRAFS